MEEADKDWVMIRMVGGWMFLLVPAHPQKPSPKWPVMKWDVKPYSLHFTHSGSPGQRAVKRLLLLLLCVYICVLWCVFVLTMFSPLVACNK